MVYKKLPNKCSMYVGGNWPLCKICWPPPVAPPPARLCYVGNNSKKCEHERGRHPTVGLNINSGAPGLYAKLCSWTFWNLSKENNIICPLEGTAVETCFCLSVPGSLTAFCSVFLLCAPLDVTVCLHSVTASLQLPCCQVQFISISVLSPLLCGEVTLESLTYRAFNKEASLSYKL